LSGKSSLETLHHWRYSPPSLSLFVIRSKTSIARHVHSRVGVESGSLHDLFLGEHHRVPTETATVLPTHVEGERPGKGLLVVRPRRDGVPVRDQPELLDASPLRV